MTADIAMGIQHSIGKLQLPEDVCLLKGRCSDAGGAGLESVVSELQGASVAAEQCYVVANCMLHNLQSGICEPIKQLLGEGGLDQRTAMQALNALYDLWQCLSHELLAQ